MSEFYSKYRNYKNLSKYLFLGVPEKRKFYGERRSQAIAKGFGYSLSQPKAKLELRRKLLAEIFFVSFLYQLAFAQDCAKFRHLMLVGKKAKRIFLQHRNFHLGKVLIYKIKYYKITMSSLT